MIDKGYNCTVNVRHKKIEQWVILVYFIAIIFIDMVVNPILDQMPQAHLTKYLNTYFYGLFFTAILILYRERIINNIKNIKNKWDKKLSITFIIAILTIFFMVFSAILLSKINIINNAQEEFKLGWDIRSVNIFIVSVILGPIVEEIIFRAAIFKLLRKKMCISAHLMTAFIFGSCHCMCDVLIRGKVEQLIAVIPLYILGLGLSIIYEKTDNIMYPIIVHMFINWISITG